MLELTIRLVVSLAIVVGLLVLLARFGSRKFRGSSGAMVQVLHRQPLSRTSAVAVVNVGARVLVLGTTEQQISVLAELDPDEVELEDIDMDPSLVEACTEEGGLRPSRSEGALAPVSKPTLVLAPPVLDPAPAEAPALRLDKLDVPAPATGKSKRPGSHRAAPAPRAVPAAGTGPLAGSILSPQTWRQALAAATKRVS